MLILVNCEDLQRFLGIVIYLFKFILNMFQISVFLWQLFQKDVEWFWGKVEDDVFIGFKIVILFVLVFKFFDFKELVILFVDVSLKGLGVVILQNDCFVVYVLKVLILSQ